MFGGEAREFGDGEEELEVFVCLGVAAGREGGRCWRGGVFSWERLRSIGTEQFAEEHLGVAGASRANEKSCNAEDEQRERLPLDADDPPLQRDGPAERILCSLVVACLDERAA